MERIKSFGRSSLAPSRLVPRLEKSLAGDVLYSLLQNTDRRKCTCLRGWIVEEEKLRKSSEMEVEQPALVKANLGQTYLKPPKKRRDGRMKKKRDEKRPT